MWIRVKINSARIITIIAILLGVVTVTVSCSGGFFSEKQRAAQLNPFLPQIPEKYIEALEKAENSNDEIFHAVVDQYASKELLVFRRFPDEKELVKDFVVTIDPEESSIGQIQLKLTNNGIPFNHNQTYYGLYKIALPLIDIKQIEVALDDGKTNVAGLERDEIDYTQAYAALLMSVLAKSNISYVPSANLFQNDSLFQNKKIIEKYANTNGRTWGIVTSRASQFWQQLNDRDPSMLDDLQFYGDDALKAKESFKSYLNDERSLEEVFNLAKLAQFTALLKIFTSDCGIQPYFVFDTKKQLLEPLYAGSGCLGKVRRAIDPPMLNSLNYVTTYASVVDSISNLNLYQSWVVTNSNFEKNLKAMNKHHPQVIFDREILGVNQRMLQLGVNAATLGRAEFLSINNENLLITIHNVTNFPIEVAALYYAQDKLITSVNPKVEIVPNHRDTIAIDLPRSFENLFVHKKTKQTGFVLEKDIYDLGIKVAVKNTGFSQQIGVLPYQPEVAMEQDLFRAKDTLSQNKHLLVNENRKEVRLGTQRIDITAPLIIPEGYTFVLEEGTVLNMLEGGMIIANGPLRWLGTSQNPIKMISNDKKGQGMLVLAGGKQSFLEHVVFSDLTHPKYGDWSVTGAVTFYESPVHLDYVTIENNRCEDALNIVRTNFTINHSKIANTQSDAFDGDFVEGEILNSEFFNLGNDGIDVSGSSLAITNVLVTNAGDKGLSAGENSQMKLDNITILDSEIGIAGKDLSTVTGKKISIVNNKLAFTAFKKKPEFGPSHISLTQVALKDIETEHLVENKSSLQIDGENKTTIKNVKSKMYGVEFGKSSKDTRNIQ